MIICTNQWTRVNGAVEGAHYCSLEVVMSCYQSKKVCTNQFGQKLSIKWEIKNAKQGTDTISDFYAKMTALWNQLTSIEPQFVCTTDSTTIQTFVKN